jgi:hypothetical protein
MRVSRLPVVAALAIALGGSAAALAATPALASSPIPTEVINFKASTAQISAGHTQITLSGQVVETDHSGVGVAGATVYLTYLTDGIDNEGLAPATTGADGTFTSQQTLTAGGIILASSAPGPGYAGSSNLASVDVTSTAEPTRITLNPQPKSLAGAGTELTFTGKAEAQASDGQWVPLVTGTSDADTIEILVNGFPVASTATKADGTFSVSLDAGYGGEWQAMVVDLRGSTDSLYQESSSNAVAVNMRHQTRVDGWSVAVNSAADRTVTITGTVQGLYGTPWYGAPGLTVTYYYQDLPSGTWIKAGSAETDANGVFTSVLTAGAGHLRWRVVIAGQNLNGDVYLATATSTHDTVIAG